MATVNLGNIKFNWKGTYNAGTAYAIDDVVSYNGSSYVCISATTGNLPTVTAKWNVMSSAGTNGTDVGTTITTQGDILYRDGSGLQRLGAGTNGQFLKTQGTGANPIWANNTAGVIQTVRYKTGNGWQQSMSGTAFQSINNGSSDFDVTITPSSASNSILIFGMINMQPHATSNNYGGSIRVLRSISGGSQDGTFAAANTHGSRPRGTFWISTQSSGYEPVHTFTLCDKTHNTTSAITYTLQAILHGNHTATFNYHPNHGDGVQGYRSAAMSTIMAQELGHTIVDA